MRQQLKDVAYRLKHNAERFERLGWKEDIYIVGDLSYGKIHKTDPLDLPDPLIYQGDLVWLQFIDYPFPHPQDNYGVMSKRMLDVLLSVGPFPHRVAPVVIEDWVAEPIKRQLPANHDYVSVQLTEYADVFDYERSVYERETYAEPEFDEATGEEKWFVGEVDEFAFRTDSKGLPPVFRVKESPVDLFISDEARTALKTAGIAGTRYVSLRGYESEIDVPVPFLEPKVQESLAERMRKAA